MDIFSTAAFVNFIKFLTSIFVKDVVIAIVTKCGDIEVWGNPATGIAILERKQRETRRPSASVGFSITNMPLLVTDLVNIKTVKQLSSEATKLIGHCLGKERVKWGSGDTPELWDLAVKVSNLQFYVVNCLKEAGITSDTITDLQNVPSKPSAARVKKIGSGKILV